MNHATNEVKTTSGESNDLIAPHRTMAFSPCDEGTEIMRSSTVELCVCHTVPRCHKKRLVWNSVDEKLEVTETVENDQHERIEVHFYEVNKDEKQGRASLRTIKTFNMGGHHKYIHIGHDRDNGKHLKELREAKKYAHTKTIVHDELAEYVFEVEIIHFR